MVRDFQETIAALSTPEGTGGIAVIRISGSSAADIALHCISADKLKPMRLTLCDIYDPDTGDIIDRGIVAYFKAPRSYTGEDVVEISVHGSRIVTELTLKALFRAGARPALPGEFTRRAFVNGKMDLAQAEAVADVIHAETERSLKAARQTMRGRYSGEISSIREKLMEAAALLETGLDFVEEAIETIPPQEVMKRILAARKHIDGLLASYKTGKILREGIRIPITGPPNAGKSSLLNAILDEERVITSEIPGTTRDYIEEHIRLDGYHIRLFDTAGLHETSDILDRAGIAKTHKLLTEADIIIRVEETPEAARAAEKQLNSSGKPFLVVLNKSDMLEGGGLKNHKREKLVVTSAINGTGISDLMKQLADAIHREYPASTETAVVTHLRHKEILETCRESLEHARKSLDSHLPAEFTAHDLREAVDALDDITGRTTSGDILNIVFNRFCIGK